MGMVCRCPVVRKTLRSNRASNLAKCSNFFPFTLAPFPPLSAARPFYWQVGMFALCIAFACATFMNFAREKRQLFRSFLSRKWKFFSSRFFQRRIKFRIDGFGYILLGIIGIRRNKKGYSRGYSGEFATMSHRDVHDGRIGEEPIDYFSRWW